jgi:hypothetical protein
VVGDVAHREFESPLDRLPSDRTIGHDGLQPLDGAATGDLASGMTAHSIGHDEERILREERVLIRIATTPLVGRSRPGDQQLALRDRDAVRRRCRLSHVLPPMVPRRFGGPRGTPTS